LGGSSGKNKFVLMNSRKSGITIGHEINIKINNKYYEKNPFSACLSLVCPYIIVTGVLHG